MCLVCEVMYVTVHQGVFETYTGSGEGRIFEGDPSLLYTTSNTVLHPSTLSQRGGPVDKTRNLYS